MVKVKRGTSLDIPQMVTLGKEFWESTDYHKMGIPFNPRQSAALATALLDAGIVQVAYDEDRLVGFILMIVAPIPFVATRTAASEMAFYVSPEYRDVGVGKRLMRQAENVAKQLGVSRISLTHLADAEGEKAGEVYVDEGYSPSEISYTKELR